MQVQNKQAVTIDMKKNSIIQLPQFIQNDTNILEVTVLENGVAAVLSNITRIVLNYKRADKVVISRLLTAAGNKITYEIGTEEMLKAGYGEIEIQFFENTKRISTKRFKVYVLESIETDKIYKGTDLTLLQELFVEVSDVKSFGDYAKSQGDYAKAQADTAKTNWVAPVANFAAIATTYKNPKLGDTVQCLDNGYVYRYTGSKWEFTQGYSATALAKLTTDLADKAKQTEVDKKRDKSVLLTQYDLSDELKQQINGNAPILQTIGDGIVSPSKTNFYKTGKNLFNKDTAIVDYMINETNGNLSPNTSYYASDYIPVLPNTSYAESSIHRVAFYDSNKVFLSGINNAVNTFTTPTKAAYMRASVLKTKIDTFQIEQGSIVTYFESYKQYIPKTQTEALHVTSDDILPKAVKKENTDFFVTGKNLVDPALIVDGYQISNSSGVLTVNATSVASGFIPIDENTQYTTNELGTRTAFYDVNKVFISGHYDTGLTTNTFTTPAGAKFMRCSCSINNKSVFQVEKGNAKTAFEAFKIYIPQKFLDVAATQPGSTSKIYPSGGIAIESINKDLYFLWYDKTNKIAYAKDKSTGKNLYQTQNNGKSWELIWTFASGVINGIFRTSKGTWLIWDKNSANLFRATSNFSTVTRLSDDYRRRPLNEHIGVAEQNGVIMFAEYSTDFETRIWKSTNDGVTWIIARGGTDVRHYHTLQIDPYTGHWWATTGDADSESKFLKSTDDGVTWQTIDSGRQQVRTCGLVFRTNEVLWAMDTAGVKPYVYKSNKTTWSPIQVGAINNVAIGVIKTVDNNMLISARLEPNTVGSLDEVYLYLSDGASVKKILSLGVIPNATNASIFILSNVDDENRIWANVTNTEMDGLMSIILPVGVI